MKRLWGRIRRWVYRRATAVLKHAGMAVVAAEDWEMILATSAELYAYVRTSGHINNGRHKSRKRLHELTKIMMEHCSEDELVREITG